MVDINKCDPCLETDSCCNLICKNLSNQACTEAGGTWNKELGECCFKTREESRYEPDINSDSSITLNLKLGLSNLFPGLDCDSSNCPVDLRLLDGLINDKGRSIRDKLSNYYIRIEGKTKCGAIEGFEYTPATLESPAKFTRSTLEFPIDIGLDTLHLQYLKPLIEVTQDYQNADDAEKPNIIKNFDPSCLLNEQWVTNNANANFISFKIKSIYFNNLTRSVPLVIYNFLDNDRDAISRDLSKFRTYKVKDDGSVIFVSVRSLKDLLNPTIIEQNRLDAMQFAWDGIDRPDIVPPELKEAVQAIKNGPNSRQKEELKNARDVVVAFRKYLDNIAAALWDPNRTNTDRLSPADRRAWLAFQYLKDCINVPLDAPNPSNGVTQFNNRDKVREILADIFVLGKLCPTNKNKDLCDLLDCLGKKITVKDGNPTGQFELTNLKAAIYRKGGTLLAQNGQLYQKCYGNLNVKIVGGYVGNALKVTFIIGEDACDSGDIPLRKINYAVLKRPLEFIFTNDNNCEPSNLIDSCKTSCCTTYDDSKKLLNATGIDYQDFGDKLVYSKLDKEDDKFIGYTVYKCKTCDEIKQTEINDFCEFNTPGFCCSEGYWEQVGGLETLKKPITAGLTDIFSCCRVAQNEFGAFNKNSHFIFSTFENSVTNKPIIVEKDRSGLQLLKSDLENSCLPKTKCCIDKRDDGGACFYRKPKAKDRTLSYDISFEVNVLTLPEDHEGSCEESPHKFLGDTRDAKGSWDALKAFNDGLIPNFNLLMRASGDEFSVVLPSCDPFDTLKVRLSQSKSLPQDKQLIEFVRILLELKKLNRWVFNKDDKKNQNIIDIWDKELAELKINMDDIDSNSDDKIHYNIINSMVSGKLKAYNNISIKRFATEGAAADDEQWIPYNYNGQPYSCNSYRSCFDFLKLEKKIFVYSETVNYCNLLDSGLLTNDMERLVAYLTNSSGTKFKSIINGALNRYAIKNKIEFIPGKCRDMSVLPPVVVETKYGCISTFGVEDSENCCPNPSSFSFSPSRGSYLALGGNKTLLDDPPHPIGTYSNGNNPYNANLLTQLKEAIVNDMLDDFNTHNGDGSGTYKIKLNIKEVNPCLEYDIEGTFKDYEGNIIDSELKCKNHAQHILECCNPDIEISGGTCTTTPQTFNDYVYIPGLASLSQATVTKKTGNCNMTADIKDTLSGNRVFIFSTNNPNPVLTNFGDKEVLVTIVAARGEIPNLYNKSNKIIFEQQKFRIKANELLTKLTTNDIPYSKILKDRILQHLNNLIKKNATLPQPTDGHMQRTIWDLYIESDQIEVKNYPTDGCLELSAVQYTQKGKDKWVPSEYICIDNVPYPPHIFGVAPANRVPGTKYYNGEVVSNCGECDNDPVSSPPPQDPSGPTDPSDPDSVPPGCEEIKKAVDAKKSEITAILMQLKAKLLNYNEKVLAWNTNDCSTTKPTQKCNIYKKSIEYNYIDADKKLLDRLNKEDITPGKEIITQSPPPFKIGDPTPSTKEQKTKYSKLLLELEKLENDLRNCD